LDAGEHAPVVRAVVPVMEQADVPARADGVQEIEQRTGTFGKLEAEQPLVLDDAPAAADHVPHVQLGELVVAQVLEGIAALAQPLDEVRPLRGAVPELYPHEDVGTVRVAVAIVELRDAAAADRLAERPEAARTLRDLH